MRNPYPIDITKARIRTEIDWGGKSIAQGTWKTIFETTGRGVLNGVIWRVDPYDIIRITIDGKQTPVWNLPYNYQVLTPSFGNVGTTNFFDSRFGLWSGINKMKVSFGEAITGILGQRFPCFILQDIYFQKSIKIEYYGTSTGTYTQINISVDKW